MIYQTTTYNNSGNQSLPLGKVRMVLLFIMMVMGVGCAWGQDPVFSQWGGTVPGIPANTNKTTVNNAGIEGDGTSDSPYLIKNADDFAFFWAASYNGKITSSTQYWRLEANIDLDNQSWATYIEKNGTFKGKFDGNNKIIKNMTLAPSKANVNYGLFCQIQGESATDRAEVKDLTIDNSTIAPGVDLAGNTGVGFVAGKTNSNADIVNVKVTNSTITYANNISGNQYVGGIVGQTNTDTKVQNCSVTTLDITTSGTTTNAYFCGLIGHVNSQTSITNCSTSGVTITYNTIANASRISGFIGYTKGAADAPIIINGCTVSNTKVDLKAGINNGSYIGALVAQTQDNTQIGDGTDANKNTVTSPIINIGGDIKAASYIGGAIGDLAGATDETKTSVVKKLTVTSPTITINNYSAGTSLTGGVFGRVSTFTAVDGVNLTGTTLSFTKDLSVAQQIGTFAGTITGNATQQITVKNVTIDASNLTFGSSATSNTLGLKAGVIGQVSTNVLLDTWKVTGNCCINVNGSLNKSVLGSDGKETAADVRLGGFVGYMTSAAGAPLTINNIEIGGNSVINVTGAIAVKGAQLGGVLGYSELANAANNQMSMDKIEVKGTTSITVTGGINTGSYLGGFAGYILGRAATSCSVKIDNITLASSSIIVGGEVKATSYIGGLAGNLNTCCALKKWEITKSANITMNDVTTASSYVGGAIGNINGASGYNSNLNELTVGSPSVTINKVSIKDCYIGAVFGRINTYCDVIKTINVSNPTLTYNYTDNKVNVSLNLGTLAGGIIGVAARKLNMTDVTITGNAQLTVGDVTNATTNNICQIKAGLIGQSNTNVNLDSWTINSSAVTINGSLTTSGSQIGGFAGNLVPQDANDAQYWTNNITLNTSTINVTGNITVGSYLAGFVGYFQGRSKEGSKNNSSAITVKTANITVGGNITVASFFGGLAGQINTGCQLTNWKVTEGANLSFEKDITAASFIGGAFGQIKDAAYYPVSVSEVDLTNVNLTFGGENKIQLNIGGVAGDLTGVSGTPVTMQNVTTNGTKINLNCNQTSAGLLYVGGCVGNQTFAEVRDVTIENEEIILNANHANVMGIGGAFGRLLTYSTVEDVTITGTTIRNKGSHTITRGNKAMSIGGTIGLMETDPVTVVRCSSNVDINLSGYIPATAGNLQNNAFIIGGVIGRFNNALTTLPMNLSYSGKIYAPYAVVGPIVGAFVVDPTKAVYLYDDYSGENLTNAVSQWANTDTWTYKDYKLGLSSDVLTQKARTKNYSDSDLEVIDEVSYLVIKDPSTTFTTGNRIADVEKRSRTVLSYTQDNKNQDFGIYPQWTTNAATYPAYYMYYMQGVNCGFYAEKVLWPILEPVVGELNTYGVSFSDPEINPEDYYYVWYIDGKEYEGAHGHRLEFNPGDLSRTMYAKLFEDEDAYREGRMLAITNTLATKNDWFALITSDSQGSYTLNFFDDSRNIYSFDSHYSFEYQWFVSNEPDGSDAVEQSGTDATISIPLANTADKKYVLCQCTIKYDGQVSYSKLLLYNVNMNHSIRVVYLQLTNKPVNNVTASNGILYSKENAGVNGAGHNTFETAIYGLIPEKPVSTWAGAYELLKAYTEPTQADVTAHGGKWTSATVYDDEAYYLANKDSYPFDIYKRDGNKRKVKPIDQCESNWDKNIIVLMGLSNDGYFNNGETNQHVVDGARANKPVTITGMYNNVNYYGFHSNSSGDLSINADHRFENMGFGVYDKGIGATESVRYRIYAHRWNVHASRGLLMGWAAALKWGPDVVPVNDENKKTYKITNADPSTGTPVGNYTADIAIMGGYLNDNTSDNPEMFEYINHGRDDIGQQIKIESGFWGPVCPGNRQTDSGNATNTYYTMGGPDHPAKTTITVDICREDNDGNEKFNSAMPASTIDVACLLSGNHEGTMYADVTLNILSGHMGRIVNGIKGAQRRQVTKPESFTTGGHYRHIINYGTKETPNWTEIAAPAPDSFFGRGILNFAPASSQNNTNADINGRVSVIELYCGSLGRGHNDGNRHPEVCSYFYGLSEVNIMGGTFKKTVYGAGAGGVNGIGTAEHHTDDDGIPYWNTDLDPGKTHVWYAPYDYIKDNGHKYEFVKIKMMGTGSDDPNLEDGYVNMEKTRNTINITGGIFGSESSPASIYGGGFGEANAALINPSSSTNDANNIKNTYNTPNHQGGNMYGAADGLVTQINISGDAKIYGNIYGGGMGSMRYYRYFVRAGEGIVNYTDENQAYTHIVNPGGDTYNKPNGIDWQKVHNIRRNADNYLNVGQVFGNTKITISGNVEVFGNVYGAGEGVPDMTMDEFFSSADTDLGLSNQLSSKATILNYSGTASNGKRTAHITADDTWVAFPNLGKLYGDSKVIIDGNTHIHGNVYGGGKAGAMDGNSTVVVKSGIIEGDVFGAGEGEADRPDKAKVTGNTNVIVNSKWEE